MGLVHVTVRLTNLAGDEPGYEPILGSVAPESVGITVDPVSRTLKRLPAKPLK